jgi:glycosyltransferase involved in cell wall biosynthesis
MGPSVVVVSPPVISCRNPPFMAYGGVERDVWRLGRLLRSVGCEVVPVASSDSDFGPGISARGLSSEPSWYLEDRIPRIYSEDAPALLDSYARHAGGVVEREQADAVVLLGPSPQVLRAAIGAARPAVHRIIVVLCNGPNDNLSVVPILASEPDLKVLCLSEMQRSSFGTLADRIEVVTGGIPVAAVPFSADPASRRRQLMRDHEFSAIRLRPERPLIGQIDYFHPNKGMLITLEAYRSSGMSRTHDLVLAGGMGWQLHSRDETDSSHAGELYLSAMRKFIHENNLVGAVQILGPLSGWKVAELYGCMDIAISPVRLEHHWLWPYSPGILDPEAYGQGRAIANSAGTPVLMSEKYDPSFAADTRPELRFRDTKEGADRLRCLASMPGLRPEMRSFAERRDAMTPGLARYVRLIGERAEKIRGMHFDPPRQVLENAVAELVGLESKGPRL